MKKVCVLLPWSIAGDSRAQRTARTMARHAEVHVYFVATRPGDGAMEKLGDSTVRLFPVHLRPSLLDRVLRHSLFFLVTASMTDAVRASGHHYDVVYAHDLPATYPALRIARRNRARVLYDVHDLSVETLSQAYPESAPFPRSLRYLLEQRFMRWSGALWERRFVRRSDLVMTVTAGCLGYLEDRYGLKDGLVIHNYPAMREVPRSERLYEACSIPAGSAIVLYHGSFGKGRYLELILRSAPHLAPGTVLALVGNGPLEAGLKALAARPEFKGKVHFLDLVPYEELLPLASGATLGLALIEVINLSKKYSLGNKVTEYMAAGVPVLASDSPENRRIVEESDAGFLWNPTTPEALGARINGLLGDRSALAAKGANGRRAFRERFHWEACEPIFEKAFLKLLEAA